MRDFQPIPAPPGRLARLGVVLDPRNSPNRLREVARMCDRAGIDALWVRDGGGTGGGPRLEAWTAAVLAGVDTSRARVGVMLDIDLRPAPIVAAMVGTLDVALAGRLEIGVSGGPARRDGRAPPFESPGAVTRAGRVKDYAALVRTLLAEEPVGATVRDAPEAAGAAARPSGPPLWIETWEPPDVAAAVQVADNALLPGMPVADIRAAVHLVRRECERAGRDPSSLGIGVEVPVSIGRTAAEARARADAEPLFNTVGHPASVGIFGTLEQGQDRVVELAHLGITDLRCVLPNTADVHDLIAQLTAMVVGTTQALRPDAPRSRAPDPPPGWGGRRPRS